MALHQISGRHGLGISLAATAVTLWAALPLVLNVVVDHLSPLTIAATRFLFAWAALTLFLGARKRLPGLATLRLVSVPLLIGACLGFTLNNVLYLFGLQFITPGTAQVFFQLAPFVLVAGGVFIFGERFSRRQWFGLGFLVFGMGIFYHHRLAEILDDVAGDTLGIALIFGSAVTWAAYALAQKQLMLHLSSAQLLMFVFLGSFLLLLPMSEPSQLLDLPRIPAMLLAYAAVNSLVAHGCFTEALQHIEASRASAFVAMTPLGTLTLATLGHRLLPEWVVAEELTPLRIVGAGIVVAGSVLVAVANPPGKRETQGDSAAG